MNNPVSILTVTDIGRAIRSVRRSHKIRLDDLAATTGVSKQFVSDVEHGKPTVQMGLVLRLIAELGIHLMADAGPNEPT